MRVGRKVQRTKKASKAEAYTKMITLTLTAEDKALLVRLARAEHKSMRALVRQLLHDAAGLSTNDQRKLPNETRG